jgi:DNA-binding beta-propeller fold protein YncE
MEPILIIAEAGDEADSFHTLHSVIMDGRERIVVTDTGNHVVYLFDQEGNFIKTFGNHGSGPGEFQRPTGIRADAQGRFWVTDRRNAEVDVFDGEGNYLFSVGERGDRKGQFTEPQGIYILDELVYVTDVASSTVNVFNLEGRWLKTCGGAEATDPPLGITEFIVVDDERQVYLADEANGRVVVFERGGRPIYTLGHRGQGRGAFVQDVEGIALDAAGRLYVADEAGKRINVFTKEGQFLAVLGKGAGNGPGEFNSPNGLFIHKELNWLLVADQGNQRIQVFDLDDVSF